MIPDGVMLLLADLATVASVGFIILLLPTVTVTVMMEILE